MNIDGTRPRGIAAFWPAVLLYGAASTAGQTTPAPTFSQIRSFFTDARDLNTMNDKGAPPFHLEASYILYGPDGAVTDQGTFVVDQVSRTKFVVEFKSPLYSHAAYSTDRPDEAVFIAGKDGSSQAPPLNLLWGAFLKPLPPDETLTRFASASLAQMDAPNHQRLSCYRLYAVPPKAGEAVPPPDAGFCFEEGTKKLAACFSKPGLVIARTPLIDFEGRVVPKEIAILSNGKQVLKASLTRISKMDKIDEARFVPPSDAKLYPTKMMPTPPGSMGATIAGIDAILRSGATNVGSIQAKPGEPGKFVIQPGVAEGLLLTRPAPPYPAIAKAGRVQGTVVLRGTIGKDGLVKDLDVVDGPPLLRQVALDAVKTWTYRPFLVAGKPVEVETTVNVVFRLGDPNPAAQQPAAGAHP